MKKDKIKEDASANKPQTSSGVRKDLPEKNPTNDTLKNTATQTPGLNQEKITRDDLLPSDGDNLTN